MISVGIITLHFSVNYGAVLQCLALTESLRKIGVDVKVIDYYPRYAKYYWEPKKKYIDAIRDAIASVDRIDNNSEQKKKNIAILCLKSLKHAFFMNRQADMYREKYTIFREFRRKYLPLTKEITKFEDLNELSFDCLVTGSDQVWNPNYTNFAFDRAYFLDFGEEHVLRIAYAASTHDYENDRFWYNLISFCKNINYISVRENSVCEKINELSNEKNAITVLDPTLLLPSSEWEKFEISNISDKNYVLLYCLENKISCIHYLEQIKNKYKQLKVIDISPNKVLGNCEWRGLCSPSEFLKLIHYAQFIITDSYHGTVFSIVYNREFIALNRDKSDTRLIDLLCMVGLDSRYKNSQDHLPDEVIDYKIVNCKLNQLRDLSMNFLLNIREL